MEIEAKIADLLYQYDPSPQDDPAINRAWSRLVSRRVLDLLASEGWTPPTTRHRRVFTKTDPSDLIPGSGSPSVRS